MLCSVRKESLDPVPVIPLDSFVLPSFEEPVANGPDLGPGEGVRQLDEKTLKLQLVGDLRILGGSCINEGLLEHPLLILSEGQVVESGDRTFRHEMHGSCRYAVMWPKLLAEHQALIGPVLARNHVFLNLIEIDTSHVPFETPVQGNIQTECAHHIRITRFDQLETT